MDKTVFNKSTVFDDALSLCLKELQLLDEVRIVLVKLAISVDVGKESPVVEVIDGILKNGMVARSPQRQQRSQAGRGSKGWSEV